MPISNVGWVDLSGVEVLAQEMRTIRSRLSPAMRKATAANAKAVTFQAQSLIGSQITGRTTAGYVNSITWEMKVANASLALAEVGPIVNPQNPKQAIQLEYGNSTQAPRPHLRPALMSQVETYVADLAEAAERAVLR